MIFLKWIRSQKRELPTMNKELVWGLSSNEGGVSIWVLVRILIRNIVTINDKSVSFLEISELSNFLTYIYFHNGWLM